MDNDERRSAMKTPLPDSDDERGRALETPLPDSDEESAMETPLPDSDDESAMDTPPDSEATELQKTLEKINKIIKGETERQLQGLRARTAARAKRAEERASRRKARRRNGRAREDEGGWCDTCIVSLRPGLSRHLGQPALY